MDTLILLHDRLATAVIIYMTAIGLWGLYAYIQGLDLGGSIGGAFVIGQGLLIVQVLLGVLLVVDDARPRDSLHYLYGIVIVILLPFAYTYVRTRSPRTGLLFCSVVALFIAALAVRAIMTGR